MNKKTKFSKLVNEKIDSSKTYTIDEAISIIMEFKRESFVESVDVAYNLGVDPKHADQNIRLNLMLPHGAGKEVTVLALVNADKEKEAQDAGADFVGNKEYLEKIISFSSYNLIRHRFKNSVGVVETYKRADSLMVILDYDQNYSKLDYIGGDPRSIGNYLFKLYSDYGYLDHSNEINNYSKENLAEKLENVDFL